MQLPARIGKYELQEFLGGGMSHVYRALDTVIGRTVAVKVLTEAGCSDEEVKARFLAEARMAGNLQHDNVLGIYDFGDDEAGHPYMVMEFLRGEDLRHAIRDNHLGDVTNKLSVALQTARALEFIHAQKIIHRDIKPENIHITNNGVVKLMDFGIAKTEGLSMTRAGFVLGTPYYMAPEQVTGQNITGQVDVYSYGVLLFEIFTGAKPIAGDTVERIFYSILNEPLNLEPLDEAGAPESIKRLIGHCTAKDPAARPQGFGPVCAELERILASCSASTLQIVARNDAPRRSSVKRFIPVFALILAGAAYLAFRPHPLPFSGPSLANKIQTPTGEMELVPAGPFLYGQNHQSASLPAFYVDKTEVTNAAYSAFCKATGHPEPDAYGTAQADFPVVNVSILDAQAFAKWAGKRLPTAREWEKAARGEEGAAFPWGDQLDPRRAALGLGAPVSASAFPKGASPYGALQMIGNVWELVGELTPPTPQAVDNFASRMDPPPSVNEPWYTIRGGGFDFPQLAPDLTWDSTTVPVRWKNPNIGFRCVKDAQ